MPRLHYPLGRKYRLNGTLGGEILRCIYMYMSGHGIQAGEIPMQSGMMATGAAPEQPRAQRMFLCQQQLLQQKKPVVFGVQEGPPRYSSTKCHRSPARE